MTPAARLAAAIEILARIEAERRPAADAMAEWGRSHRFAGSKDRAAISALLYDALRRRTSAGWIMGDPSARGVLLGSLREARGLDVDAIAALCTGETHAPPPLSDAERQRLRDATTADAPAPIAGDFPEWLAPALQATFGERLIAEMQALATRAPVDLRVNTLKMTRDKVLADLAHLNPAPTPLSPAGLRIAIGPDGRAPALHAERAFIKGQFEVQDEASQLATLLTGAREGEQVLDICAGAGGKTLALAAQMRGRGQIYAFDADIRRLAPIYERLERAEARNVQVRSPKGAADPLADLAGRCDIVVVDAPCTGTGTWRRNPDAKWRIRPGALEQRVKEQDAVLARAQPCVKAGGRLAYLTCSLLIEENEDRIAAFLVTNPDFQPEPVEALCKAAGLPALTAHASKHGPGLRLSPATTGTDGFYICVLRRTN